MFKKFKLMAPGGVGGGVRMYIGEEKSELCIVRSCHLYGTYRLRMVISGLIIALHMTYH